MNSTYYSNNFWGGMKAKYSTRQNNAKERGDKYLEEFYHIINDMIGKMIEGTDPELFQIRVALTRLVQMERQGIMRCRLFAHTSLNPEATDEEIASILNEEDEKVYILCEHLLREDPNMPKNE